MTCEKCKTNIPDTAKFCPKCGTKAENQIAVQEAAIKKCPKCGAENPVSAKFCKVDGYKFQQADENAITATVESEKPVLCPKCGTAYALGIKFCKNDGAPLKEELKPTVAARQESRIKEPNRINLREEISHKIAIGKEALKNILKKHLWIGLLAVVFLVAGSGSYFYFSGRAGEEAPEITISQEPKIEKPVSPQGYKPEPSEPFVAVSADPAKLEGEINRALRGASLHGITAVVDDGLEVVLQGSVNSNYEKDRAFEIAETFTYKGIKRIRDIIFVVEQ